MSCYIKLIFNNHDFNLQVTLQRYIQLLSQFPQDIGTIISNQQYYTVKSDVKEEIFGRFILYLTDTMEPEINSDNMYEFYLLSQEFDILKEYLSSRIDENSLNMAILSSSSNQIDKSASERYISMHLDEIIMSHGLQLLQLPITSLTNIFYHQERVLNNHQIAYDLITRGLPNDNNNNDNNNSDNNSLFFILLGSLDGEKLERRSVFESLSKSKERFGYFPKINQSFFDSIEEKIDHYEAIDTERLPALEEENRRLNEENSHLRERTQTQVNSNETIISSFTNLFKGIYKEEKISSYIHKTILHYACQYNNIEVVKCIISNNMVDVNSIWILKIIIFMRF